tara:strand:- start:770 stop:970 length:201 start_codon:yes stop_codon:yes gene_type:complete
METDVQQSKRTRTIVIEVTDREWVAIKTASIYTNIRPGTITRDVLLRWADKHQAPPPDKEDSNLSL